MFRSDIFYFTLKTKASNIPTLAPPPLPTSLQGLEILAIDDNLTNHKVLEQLLSPLGVRLTFYANTEAAIDFIRTGAKIDLCLIDKHLGDIDGMQIARLIHQQNPLLPLVLLSSSGNPSDADFQDIFTVLVSKPIRQKPLYKALEYAIGRKSDSAITSLNKAIGPIAEEIPLNILVAEDDNINQKLVLKLFNRLGYQPDIAFNGLQVLEFVKQKHYHVIFMDMHMPEMDGLEATRRLKAFAAAAKLPCPLIFAMTANVLTEDKLRCFEAGMDDFISKPVTLRDMERILLTWKTKLLT